MNLAKPFRSSPGFGAKNSWRVIRPILVTASMVVIARAETHMVTMAELTTGGIPNILKYPPIAVPKMAKGLAFGRTPFVAAEQAMTRHTTPKVDSISMEP